MLVIPFELASFRIERNRRIAVEIGRRGPRGAVGIAAMALQARVGHRVRDTPVQRFADRIVGAGQSPGGCPVGVLEILAPAFRAGFAGSWNIVKLPNILARDGVLRGDEAGVACLSTSS